VAAKAALRWGKSEKLDQAQLRLQLAELEQRVTQAERRTDDHVRTCRGAERSTGDPGGTFAHLPVVETIELVPEAVPAGAGAL